MVFDYIDGAAGSEAGADRNRRDLDALELTPRFLRDVSERSLATKLFESETQVPFGIAPMGMCNLSAPGADLMLARLAARYNVPLGVSTVASTALEEVIEVAEGNAWFQLYFSGDGSGAFKLVERAKTAGYQTLVLTIDVPEVGRRPRELRHGSKCRSKLALNNFWTLRFTRDGLFQRSLPENPKWRISKCRDLLLTALKAAQRPIGARSKSYAKNGPESLS